MRQAKTVLITGAGSGIGRDAAFALAARGHRVIATTFDEAQAQALRAECQARGQALEVFKLDIASPAERELLLPIELDVLINNAGVGESGSLAEVDVGRIRRVFEVNVFATIELTQLALRGMIAPRCRITCPARRCAAAAASSALCPARRAAR